MSDGVVIPNESQVLTGEEAEIVIREIDRILAEWGYQRVRLDRWRSPAAGTPWIERGYVYGEVTIRFSHKHRNHRILHADPANLILFGQLVRDNEAFAKEAS